MPQFYNPTPETIRNARSMMHWICRQEFTDMCVSCPDSGTISFCTRKYKASISIDNDLVSLYMEEKKSGQQVFFLHFQAVDLQDSLENVRVFLNRLQEQEPAADQDLPALAGPLKVLICCTSGITSGMYAALLSERLGERLLQAEAKSVFLLDEADAANDLILLAPQVKYMHSELNRRFPGKVHMIDTLDFATDQVARTAFDLGQMSGRLSRLAEAR